MKNNTSEISFYKLTTLPIVKAVPKLIEKIYYTSRKLVVIVNNEEMQKLVDDGLWVYSTKHFIPHATCNDDFKEDQPVYITNSFENPNNAKSFLLIGLADAVDLKAEKIYYIFDGNDHNQIEFARKKWKSYLANNLNLTYWQQKLDGSWERIS